MSKKIRALFILLVLIVTLFVMTGCGSDDSKSDKKSSEDNSAIVEEVTKSKGNYDVFGCMDALEADYTLEKMNEVIGFDGELTSETESYKVYEWKLTDDTSITSQFHSNYNTATISANFPNSMITDKADFSRYDEIKTALNTSDSITYDKAVEILGAEGKMTQKTSSAVTYKWLNEEGGSLSLYFSTTTGKCTMVTGYF